MDQGFLLRAQRLLADREPARLDHGVLIATVAAQQAASAAARAQARSGDSKVVADQRDLPLVELLLAGPGWRDAASAQRGCFSRPGTGHQVNDS